jgi:hypothetical protein
VKLKDQDGNPLEGCLVEVQEMPSTLTKNQQSSVFIIGGTLLKNFI